MFGDLMAMLLSTVGGFFVMLLIARAAMRWMRISFISQVGQFVLTLTNWLVVPAQSVLPSVGRLDLACLVPALLFEALIVWLSAVLRFGMPELTSHMVLAVLTIAVFELVKSALYLLIGLVLLTAILSWVNPYSPLAPTLNTLARPFLRPVQKILPPISGIDLSPLVLLLALQVVLFVLTSLSGKFLTVLYQ
jgi:YggT family protein